MILGVYLLYTCWYMIRVFRITGSREALESDMQATAFWYHLLFLVVGCLLGGAAIWLFVGGSLIEGALVLCVAMYTFLIRRHASNQIAIKTHKRIEQKT